jgi:hypothetical protein
MTERHDEEDDGGEPETTISTREIEAEVRRAAREKVIIALSSMILDLIGSRNTTISALSILRIPDTWIKTRMTMSLLCAPAIFRGGLPQ